MSTVTYDLINCITGLQDPPPLPVMGILGYSIGAVGYWGIRGWGAYFSFCNVPFAAFLFFEKCTTLSENCNIVLNNATHCYQSSI